MGPNEKLIPLSLYEDILDESMSSDVEGALSLSTSSEGSSQYESEKELDTDEPFWEFIREPKYPQKEEESEEDNEPADGGEDEKRNNKEEDEENKDDKSTYDGDYDKN